MDFYHDPLGKTLKKIASVLPENVKTAELAEVEKLPDSAFAWPEKRAFPIHRPEDILLSTAYYCSDVQDGKEMPPCVKQNLVKAAYIWKIEDQFQKVAESAAQLTSRKPVQEYWGLQENYKGKELKRYPLFDAQHVKMASEYFSKQYAHYPMLWRIKIASKIEKRAQDLGVTLPTSSVVNVYTRKAPVDLTKVAAFIGVRVPFLNDLGLKNEAMALTKLAKALSRGTEAPPHHEKEAKSALPEDVWLEKNLGLHTNVVKHYESKGSFSSADSDKLSDLRELGYRMSQDPDNAKKQGYDPSSAKKMVAHLNSHYSKKAEFNPDQIVDVILKIDKIARLDNRYDKEFPDPFMSVYNELEKSAGEITGEGVINISGDQYKMSELGQVKPSVYEDALGTDFVTNITGDDQKSVNLDKLATILPTLPKDEKATLNQHLKKHIKKTDAVAEPNVAASGD